MNSITRLMTAGFFAQLVTLACLPLISRVFKDQDLALLALTSYITVTLIPVATLKLNEILPTIDNNRTRLLLVNAVSLNAVVVSLGVFALGVASLRVLGSFLGIADFFIIFLTAASLLLGSLFTIAISNVISKQNFSGLGKVRVYQSLFGNIFKIISGLIGFGATGLIVGNIISQSAGLRSLSQGITFFPRSWKSSLISYRVLKRFLYIAKLRVPAQFFVSVANYLPIFVIPIFFTTTDLGQYSLIFMMLAIPIKVVTDNAAHYFYSGLLKRERQHYLSLFLKVLLSLSLLGAVIFGSGYFFLERWFTLIFGDGWETARSLIPIMSLLFFWQFIGGFSAPVYNVLNLQSKFLSFSLIRLMLVVSAVLIVVFKKSSFFEYVALHSIFISGYYFYLLVYTWVTLKNVYKE